MHFYDAVTLNLRPAGQDLYSRVADQVLARLPIRNITRHVTYWIDEENSFRRFPKVENESLHNIDGQVLFLYGKKGTFVVIDMTDGPQTALEASSHPQCMGVMVSQHRQQEFEKLARHNANYNVSKLIPGYFSRNDFSFFAEDPHGRYLQSSFTELPPYTGTIDKLVFAGTIHEHTPERQALVHLRNHPDVQFYEGRLAQNGFNHRVIEKEALIREYASHRGSLALRGTSGFCFREFDLLCGGYPLFMHPFTHASRMEPLINNEHYFAIEFDPTPEIFAQRIVDRFLQVRGDLALLDKVRRGGQEWFRRNAEIPTIATNIIEWLSSTLAPKNYSDLY